jgi:hypothetical protein
MVRGLKPLEGMNNVLMIVDDLLLCQAKIRQLARPSLRQHRNLLDYICTEAPFVDPDRADERFVYHEHDFVSLEEYYETWVDSCVHRLMYAFGILRVSSICGLPILCLLTLALILVSFS